MQVVECTQGSAAWIKARLGRATTSRFKSIVQPASGQASESKGAETYLNTLIAECLIGEPVGSDFKSKAAERGNELEAEAANWYGLSSEHEPVEVGFIVTDDGRIGCSPDRLLGERGALEIKVPEAHTHVGYLRNPGQLVTDYRPQLVGQLWVCERDWVDALSYSPASDMPNVVVRVTREDQAKYLANLSRAVTAFADRMDEELKRIREADPYEHMDELDRATAIVFGEW